VKPEKKKKKKNVLGTYYAPHHKDVGGVGGIVPFFLYFVTRWTLHKSK
jgi:hypothetical protein